MGNNFDYTMVGNVNSSEWRWRADIACQLKQRSLAKSMMI